MTPVALSLCAAAGKPAHAPSRAAPSLKGRLNGTSGVSGTKACNRPYVGLLAHRTSPIRVRAANDQRN